MNAKDPARPMLITALAGAMQGVGGGLGWSLIPPLMPEIARDLSLSHAMGGVVWGAAPLGIALASPFGGAAVDRWGPRRVAGLAILVGALACGARALTADAWQLAGAMLVFGLHIGFAAPAIPKLLAAHVPAARLGRANGIALVCYTGGTALTVLVARVWLSPAVGGWRPAMVLAAGAMAGVGLLWLALVRDRAVLSAHASVRDVLLLARDRQLLRIAAMQLLLFGGYLALLGVLPRLLTDSGLSPAEVGVAVASWLAVAGLANLIGPWISDRVGLRRPFLIGGAALSALGLAALAVAPGSPGLLLAVAALGGGCVAPLLLALPLEIPGIGIARAGAALGLLLLVGQAGGFLLPVLTGAVAQAGGFQAALGLLAVIHLLIVLPALGLRETGQRRVVGPVTTSTSRRPARPNVATRAGASLVVLWSTAFGLLACDEGATRGCLVHADCASGVCGGDGQCATADAGATDQSAQPRFADVGSDAQADGGPNDTATGACKPNHDGVIDLHEAPYGPGLKAKYRVTSSAGVDTAGQLQPDGSRVWSFDSALAGDHDLVVNTQDIAGSWFLKHFPGATYAAKMTEKDALLGVFEVSAKALMLRGLVSPEAGLLATRLTYDPPVEILAFPLQEGAKWTRTTQVGGLAQGVLAAYSETYTSTVDGHGIAKTPFGNFPVLRVSTHMERQIGLLTSSLRTRLFAAECFGTVASVRSQSDETAVDFTDAADLRRLTP